MTGRKLFLAVCTLCVFSSLASVAGATSLTGSTVSITTAANGGSSQTLNEVVGAPDGIGQSIEVGGSGFSWMSANDSMDLYVDGSFNDFRINFNSGDHFIPADSLAVTLQLDSGWTFGAIALVDAIDVQVPTGSVSGDTLTFTLTNLDQIVGNGGYVDFKFDAAPPTPEPSTVGLTVLGAAALWGRRKQIFR